MYSKFGLTAIFIKFLLYHKSFSVDIHSSPQEFCYSDPECGPRSGHWKPMCHQGQGQSPINLQIPTNINRFQTDPSDHYYGQFSLKAIQLPQRIELRADHFFIQNNGHTVNLDFSSSYNLNSAGIFPGYGLLEIPYRFANAHFHWGQNDNFGSEHQINGHPYAMELHLVHYSANYRTLKQAVHSGDPDALAVASVLLQVSPTAQDHPSLAPVVKNLKFVHEKHWYWAKIEETLDFGPLIPSVTSRIFGYKGSLTTPDCFEQVNWFVFEQPVTISRQDVKAFRKLVDGRGERILQNYRPIQNQNQRKIEIIYPI